MNRLRLSPSASVTRTSVGAIVQSDLGSFLLDGADAGVFVDALARLMDGSRDRDAVVAALSGYARDSVEGLLDLLVKAGVIDSVAAAADAAPPPMAEFLRRWTPEPDAALRRLHEAQVTIVGLSPWGLVAAMELAAAGVGGLRLVDDGAVARNDLAAVRFWAAADIGLPRGAALRRRLDAVAPECRVSIDPVAFDGGRLALDPARCDLALVCAPGNDLPLLKAAAEHGQRHGVPSLFAHLDGIEARVGPATYPGETACWNCARLRLLANSDVAESAHALQAALLAERPPPRDGLYLGPMPGLLGHLIAAEAIKLLTGYFPSRLVGRMLVQNLVTNESSHHAIVRMPWCELCGGEHAAAPPTGAVAAPGLKKKLDAILTEEDLRAEYEGWIDARCGIVRHLAVVVPDDAEPDQPVTAMAIGCDYTEGTYRPAGEPFISSGNGPTRMRALIGAFGETLERYSASRYRRQDLRHAAIAELDGDVLDPATLAGYSAAQLATPGFPFPRHDPARPIHWTRGYWLDSGEPVWMPALPVYFNFRADAGERFQQVSSNGLAAGADARDAAARATCELMERDAFMLAWHARRPGVRILPDRLDPAHREVLRQLGRCGAEVELYRIGDGLPVVLCLAMGDGREWPGATASLGAHPDLAVAVGKAIMEQGAVGPYIRRMMRDGQAIPDAPEAVHGLNDHALYYVPRERREHLACLRGEATIRLSEAGPPVDLAAACAGQGVRVAIADVTSPDLAPTGLRVARAIGVGAQPIDFGFALRRLENPRLKRLLAGAAANPHPHPLA